MNIPPFTAARGGHSHQRAVPDAARQSRAGLCCEHHRQREPHQSDRRSQD
uniref:Uncharacterized protein n=1 Tax=Macrostomum lignano TaxID=282301 RepID=A0A1I8J4C5_9PLAT